MNYRCYVISILLFSVISAWSCAKTVVVLPPDGIPEIGQPCPAFTLTHVTHYPKKQVSLNDFRGKWLFLDFWFTGCSTCIRSLAKISKLQEEFSDQAQFLMIGYNAKKTERNIEETFERLRLKQGLNIASAYDSVLAHRWGVKSMPHIVVVDPKGIVRFITNGSDMTKEKVDNLLNGEIVTFVQKKQIKQQTFASKLLGHDGKVFPKDKILGHSVLTKWNGEDTYGGYEIAQYASFPSEELAKQSLKYSKVTLEWLYTTAYLGKSSGYLKFWGDSLYGKVYPYPVYELKDPTPFKPYSDASNGFYNYSLTIPPDQVTRANLMNFMQQDLDRVFGYYAQVDEREMPVWKLVAKPRTEKKIKTKGGTPYYDAWEGKSIVAGFTVRNIPMRDYIMYLCFYLNEQEKYPFIDGTGIQSNIDLTISADLTNLQDVRAALQKHGLDLIQASKKMRVLIIRDAK